MVNSIEQPTTAGNAGGDTPSTTQTPGQILQAARFEQDLSEADIANTLHLSRSVVQAIENDAFEKLPGVTFVRGYLRSYARAVNVSGDDIMEAFNAMGIEEHAPMVAPVTRVKKQITSNDKSVRWVTYLIFAGLIALVVLWWRNHNEDTAVAGGETSSVATTTSPAEASAIPVDESVTAAEKAIPVEPMAGNDVTGAVGNKNTSTDSSAAVNEQVNKSGTTEKVLNSDSLRDKKPSSSRRRAETETAQPDVVAQNSNLNKRLNMSGFSAAG